MPLSGLFSNQILLTGLIAWALAQIVKVPYEYLFTRRWNWSLLLQAGGMPSSHSALVISISYAVGLYVGFDTAEFAIAVTTPRNVRLR